MEAEVARRLVGEEGRDALALARELVETNPGLAAATALRKRLDAELAAAVLSQLELRQRARAKFADAAEQMWFTRAGLEQATRPAVAVWRAQRFREAGVRRVVDLGCGIGADAMALAAAGLEVVAVELDPATAVLAAANLATLAEGMSKGVEDEARPALQPAEVVVGAAEDFNLAEDQATFCDPARRTASGRTWRVEDFTPSWEFATGLLRRPAGGCVKLGPGLPYRLIPEQTAAEWVSENRDAVEVGLWSARFGPAERGATLLESRWRTFDLASAHTPVPATRIAADGRPPVVGGISTYLFEPDPAVIRAGAVDDLAVAIDAHRLASEIAYLTADEPAATPLAECFEILETFRWHEKTLRAWAKQHDIGVLEIKKRGVETDPAALRRRLKLKGKNSGTIVITPSEAGAQVLVVRRLGECRAAVGR